jgi:hypothetical protein
VRCLRLVVVSALVAGGLLTLGVSAEAASSQSSAILTLNSTGLPGYPATEQRFGDAGQFNMISAYYPGGFRLVSRAANYLDTWGMQLAPPAGQSFHPGHYPVVSYNPTTGQAFGQIFVGATEYGYLGDIDILDWVPGPNNLPSRFDIVFRDGTSVASQAAGYFGEIRLGEPNEGAVHLGSRHIEWPTTAVGSTRITGTEWLHNTSSRAVSIGAPLLAGANATDWRVTHNSCPATLAAGATCAIALGFSPAAGGPQVSTLQVPVGGQIQTVSLTGNAPLGTSILTYSGTDWISGGRTNSFPNGKYLMSAAVSSSGVFSWTESQPYTDWNDPIVEISAPARAPLAVGTHATVGTLQTSGSLYGEDTSGLARGCFGYSGSMTVHAFTLDAAGVPAMANIDYTQLCTDEQDPRKVMTAHLLWQYRSDTTPPKPPTGIGMTGATVHWTKSASNDAVESIARLVPGSGQDATPTTGYPLSSGTATTATLPTLNRGEAYTIEVFAVDAAGNVSSPLKKTVLG